MSYPVRIFKSIGKIGSYPMRSFNPIRKKGSYPMRILKLIRKNSSYPMRFLSRPSPLLSSSVKDSFTDIVKAS